MPRYNEELLGVQSGLSTLVSIGTDSPVQSGDYSHVRIGIH